MTLNEPNWSHRSRSIEFRRAQDLRVADAHAAEQDGEAGLGLADKRPMRRRARCCCPSVLPSRKMLRATASPPSAGEEIPAEAIADEAFRTGQRRPRARRPEVVAQVLADAQRAAGTAHRSRRCRASRPMRGTISYSSLGSSITTPRPVRQRRSEGEADGRLVVKLAGPAIGRRDADQAMEIVLHELRRRPPGRPGRYRAAMVSSRTGSSLIGLGIDPLVSLIAGQKLA